MTTNVEPTEEKVPPAAIVPLVNAPVEKFTVPNEWPFGATTPLKLVSSEPFEVIPLFEMEIVPYLFVRSMPLAHAAIGNVNARSAKATTRLIVVPPKICPVNTFAPSDLDL